MPRQFGVPEDLIAAVQLGQKSISEYSPYLSPIHGKHVIGVNAAFLLGSWIDVMIYGDGGFYFKNKDVIANFHNVKVSCNPNARAGRPGVHSVKYVPRDGNHLYGITTKANMVSWNKHTGGAAINLAYHFGAKKIYLLGFDMRTSPNGQQHWHGHYPSAQKPRTDKQLPFKRHLESFGPISNDAKVLGIEILNVSKDSSIQQLRKVELKDVL